MNFLITGGEGFIGRNIKKILEADNHDVKTLDVEGKPNYKNSILDFDSVSDAVRDTFGIFHLAATTSPPQFETDLFQGFNTNVIGTLNVLKAAADNNVKRVVLASSSAIYGNLKVPGKEDMVIPAHENMYSTTKLFDEYLGKYFTIRNELEVVFLRFFNTYGTGENSKGLYSSVISKFFDSIAKKEKPVIFGEGTQQRDFIYVEDLAEASKIAMFKAKVGEAYNIGTGISTSFNDIAKIFSDLFDGTIEFTYQKNPFKNYQMFTQADMTKTFSTLDWKPKYSLVEGIKKMKETLNIN